MVEPIIAFGVATSSIPLRQSQHRRAWSNIADCQSHYRQAVAPARGYRGCSTLAADSSMPRRGRTSGGCHFEHRRLLVEAPVADISLSLQRSDQMVQTLLVIDVRNPTYPPQIGRSLSGVWTVRPAHYQLDHVSPQPMSGGPPHGLPFAGTMNDPIHPQRTKIMWRASADYPPFLKKIAGVIMVVVFFFFLLFLVKNSTNFID